MKKAERLNAMQRYVYRKRRFTLRELMEEFGISRSTAIRSVQSMEELGLPLYAEHGRGGGYRVLDTASLPPVSFTDDEVLSLYFAMQAVRGIAGDPFRVSFASIHAKFMDVVSEEQRRQIQRFEHRIAFSSHESAASAEPGEHLEQLLQAAVRGQVLAIHYASGSGAGSGPVRRPDSSPDSPGPSEQAIPGRPPGSPDPPDPPRSPEQAIPNRSPGTPEATEAPPIDASPGRPSGPAARRIQPFAVYAARGFWYCRAYDLDKSDYRVFRCDRILSAEPVADEPLADLLPLDLRDAHTLRRPSPQAIPFRCAVAPEAVSRLRRGLYPSMTLTKPDAGPQGEPGCAGGAILSGTYEPQETDFIVSFLAGFGESLQILKPETLRTLLRAHYLRLIERL